MTNFNEKANFIWSIAELLRDSFKRSKYQDVILPLTVLRRLDCVLAPTKQKVLAVNAKLKAKDLANRYPQLCKASGFAFYKYQPPRPLEEIEADIKTLEKDILGMLSEVAG